MRIPSIVLLVVVFLFSGCQFDPGAKPTDPEPDAGGDVGNNPDSGTARDMRTGDGIDVVTPDMDDMGDSPDGGELCGNGMIDSDETCDGDCPTTCDDQDTCTTDTLTGSADTCDAVCEFSAITQCDDTDGCCPAGCDNTNDADCAAVCDNGVIESGETCDQNCPATCDDQNTCTTNTLGGSPATCDVVCTFPAITSCTDDDGCCAPGCNANNDNDCIPTCGNSIVEAPETCDGTCPSTCDDTNACTTDVMRGSAAACDAVCQNTPVTACLHNDGCCPPGCNSTNDSDCSASCDNGVLEAPETCDPIATCPTACDDNNACTSDTLTGAAALCSAACSFAPITSCTNADGCCAPGCNAGNDDDCVANCGNMIVEPGEQCDDGNANPNDGCDQCVSTTPPTAFLLTDLDLMDPHMYTALLGFICTDITNTVAGQDGVNPQIQNAIQGDANSDGALDLSLITVFRPLDQAAAAGAVDFMEGDCSAPIGATSCVPATGATPVNYTFTNMSMGTCLAPYPATTTGYSPAIANPNGPCFVTDAQTLTLDLGGISVVLNDAQIGATYVGNPAASLSTGLVRGFLTQANAEATIMPSNLPLVGGETLASLLPGYPGNCSSNDDRDTHPTLGVGWWLYFNFPANQVTFSEP